MLILSLPNIQITIVSERESSSQRSCAVGSLQGEKNQANTTTQPQILWLSPYAHFIDKCVEWDKYKAHNLQE